MHTITLDAIRSAFNLPPGRRPLTIPGYHSAAVLVPLIVSNSSAELLFTLRTHTVEAHKGQISFPGGMVDNDDRDIIHTALREAEEEIGLAPASVEIVGMLDDMPTPTGFVITPIVGVIHELPKLSPNPQEVAEVFCAPLNFFCDRNNGRTELRMFRGKEREIWFYDYGNRVIWGATAMMIRSLLAKLHLAE